jgi:predicted nucleotidyltransferase
VPGYDPAALAAAAERLGLRLVVRYGSRAEASERAPAPGSDLDVAVLAGEAYVSPLHAHTALAAAFPNADLDVALLNGADPLFRYEALRRSDLLWGDPDLYAEARVYAWRDFLDSADLRKLEDRLADRALDALLDGTH